jgi:hippurate hydrolase
MASDDVTITLDRRRRPWRHAAPGGDPVVAAASIVMALQTIVSRNVDPQQMAIVTVGAIHAGVPTTSSRQQVTMELTVRALDREVRNLLESASARWCTAAGRELRRARPISVDYRGLPGAGQHAR